MTLVDTSVWIDFFRGSARADRLEPMLEEREVRLHPWVLGELALGHVGPRRTAWLRDLARVPPARVIADGEVVAMIDARRIAGSGIGWVDAQLLASALVDGETLWTHDERLARVAARLRVAAPGR